MSHHPSCKPNDRDLVYKCHQCGLEEPAEHLENLRAELKRVSDELANEKEISAAYQFDYAQVKRGVAELAKELAEWKKHSQDKYKEHELAIDMLNNLKAELAKTKHTLRSVLKSLDEMS